jgi:membrane protease YdiL (CAAX protease family)
VSVPVTGNLYRTTPADSWRWIKWDVPGRLLPLALAPVIFLWVSRTPAEALGLSFAHVGRDLLLAIPISLGAFGVATAFNDYLARRARQWFVPDGPDLLVQTGYYVVLNAAIEEWFFRGFLQGSLIRWWHAPAAGLLVATLIYGAYHFLGRWAWRPVAGTTLAGLALAVIYLWQPAPASLLLPTIAHAAFTCGFLSLGPYVLFIYRRSRGRIQPHVEAPPVVS